MFTINRLSFIWELNVFDKIKRIFLQAAVMSILQCECTTWTLTKLDGKCTRTLQTILNKSWKQHPTKTKMYGKISTISKNIEIRRTTNSEHCWRSKNEFISDVLQGTRSYVRVGAGRLDRTYLQQLWPE